MYPSPSLSDFDPSYLLNLPSRPLELRAVSAPASSLPPFWGQSGAPDDSREAPRLRMRTLSADDEEDDEFNIDTSNMTQEQKSELKAQRKLKKMNKEKLKRLRVNDQFDQLCQVLEVGKTTRVEKLTVLNATLRAVHQLKAENKLLKEQTQQMKDLLSRRQSGEPVPAHRQFTSTSFSPPSSGSLPLLSPQWSCARGRGRPEAEAMPPLELNADEEQVVVKQDMMSFAGKQETVLSTQTLSQESALSWNAMFAQPQHNDLDFAFGDTSFMWMDHPGQAGAPVFPTESECDFNPFVIPKPDHDNSVDLFLATSDECDLLC